MERLGKLFASDKRVHSRLLWRPSLDRVQVEQTLTEIDKRRAIVELYRGIQIRTGMNDYAMIWKQQYTQRATRNIKGIFKR